MIALRRICILIFIGVGLSSCIQLLINDYYTYRFDGKYTGIDTLINVDGYYYNLNGDILNTGFMFYREGTFASGLGIHHKINNKVKDSVVYIYSWGKYIIIGDTIKTQSIQIDGIKLFDKYVIQDGRFFVLSRWFLIINRDTLMEISYKHIPEFDWDKYFLEYLNTKAYFTPIASRPDSSCLLKNNSWAWKDVKIIK